MHHSYPNSCAIGVCPVIFDGSTARYMGWNRQLYNWPQFFMWHGDIVCRNSIFITYLSGHHSNQQKNQEVRSLYHHPVSWQTQLPNVQIFHMPCMCRQQWCQYALRAEGQFAIRFLNIYLFKGEKEEFEI